MAVSENRGTPKWMVKIMENPIKMDDLGGETHYFWKHPYMPKMRRPTTTNAKVGVEDEKLLHF